MDALEGSALALVEPPIILSMTLLVIAILPQPDDEIGTLILGGEWEYIFLNLEPCHEDRRISRERFAILIHGVGSYPSIMELVFTTIRGGLTDNEGKRVWLDG